MAATETIFDAHRKKGLAEGLAEGLALKQEAVNETTRTAIKGFINKTRLSDVVIADTLDVSVELVKTIRAEIKAEKLATALKKTDKAAKPKTKKP